MSTKFPPYFLTGHTKRINSYINKQKHKIFKNHAAIKIHGSPCQNSWTSHQHTLSLGRSEYSNPADWAGNLFGPFSNSQVHPWSSEEAACVLMPNHSSLLMQNMDQISELLCLQIRDDRVALLGLFQVALIVIQEN